MKRLLVLHGGAPALKLGHLPERMRESTSKESPEPRSSPSRSRRSCRSWRRPCAPRPASPRPARGRAGISRQRAYRMMQGRTEIDLDSLRGQGTRSGQM